MQMVTCKSASNWCGVLANLLRKIFTSHVLTCGNQLGETYVEVRLMGLLAQHALRTAFVMLLLLCVLLLLIRVCVCVCVCVCDRLSARWHYLLTLRYLWCCRTYVYSFLLSRVTGFQQWSDCTPSRGGGREISGGRIPVVTWCGCERSDVLTKHVLAHGYRA